MLVHLCHSQEQCYTFVSHTDNSIPQGSRAGGEAHSAKKEYTESKESLIHVC